MSLVAMPALTGQDRFFDIVPGYNTFTNVNGTGAVASSGDKCRLVVDQLGNGFDHINPSSTTTPEYLPTDGPNGEPCAILDGTDDFWWMGQFARPLQFNIIYVLRMTGPYGGAGRVDSLHVGRRDYLQLRMDDGAPRVVGGSVADIKLCGTAIPVTTWGYCIFSIDMTALTISFDVNGAAAGTLSPTAWANNPVTGRKSGMGPWRVFGKQEGTAGSPSPTDAEFAKIKVARMSCYVGPAFAGGVLTAARSWINGAYGL